MPNLKFTTNQNLGKLFDVEYQRIKTMMSAGIAEESDGFVRAENALAAIEQEFEKRGYVMRYDDNHEPYFERATNSPAAADDIPF